MDVLGRGGTMRWGVLLEAAGEAVWALKAVWMTARGLARAKGSGMVWRVAQKMVGITQANSAAHGWGACLKQIDQGFRTCSSAHLKNDSRVHM